MAAIVETALRDAHAWVEGGADALIVENFGDVPFRKEHVLPQTVAAMTVVVAAIAAELHLPLGVNVLRNDVLSAVAIAAMTGSQFVRANVYVGAEVTDQGLIEGCANDVQASIRSLGAPVEVWADIGVKHSAPLAPRPLGEMALDALDRGLATAVIVTGQATGRGASKADLIEVRDAIGDQRLVVGSGVTVESIYDLPEVADGVIVGTAAKVDGIVTNLVDPTRVRQIVDAC